MTAQGQKVLRYLLEHQQDVGSRPAIKSGDARISANFCSFPFSDGDDRGYLLFWQKDGSWRFHDLVMTKIHGNDVELSTADAIDHPIRVRLANIDWWHVVDTCLAALGAFR